MKLLYSVLVCLFCLFFSIKANALDVLATGYQAMQKGDYREALAEFKPIAQIGNDKAQYYVAYFHEKGLAVKKDYKEAFRWYEKAANQGNIDAILKIAWLYETGKGVPVNYTKSRKWYQKAAKEGSAPAMRRIGKYYLDGKGDFPDVAKAYSFLKKAADQGDEKAQSIIEGNLNIQEHILGKEQQKGDVDPIKEDKRLILGEVKYMIEKLSKKGLRGRSIKTQGLPSIIEEQEGKYKVIIPKVTFEDAQKGKVRLGDVLIEVKPKGDAKYEFRLTLPKRISVLNNDNDVLSLIAPGRQNFKGVWSAKLHVAEEIRASFANFMISSVSSVLTAKIKNLDVNMASIETSEGVLDISNIINLNDVEFFSSLGQDNPIFSVGNIIIKAKTDDFDVIKYRKQATEIKEFVEKIMSKKGTIDYNKLSLYNPPKFEILWNENQAVIEIEDIKIEPNIAKGKVGIKKIKIITKQDNFDENLKNIAFEFSLDGIKQEKQKKEFPERIEFAYSIKKIPAIEIINTVVKKLPDIMKKIKEIEEKKKQKTLKKQMNLGKEFEKNNSKQNIQNKPLPSKKMVLFAGLSKSLQKLATDSGLMIKLDKLNVFAKNYIIKANSNLFFNDKADLKIYGSAKLKVHGFDEIVKQTTPKTKFEIGKPNKNKTVNKQISPLFMLMPYRMLANKTKDEENRVYEEFVVKIPKKGKITLNDKVMFPSNQTKVEMKQKQPTSNFSVKKEKIEKEQKKETKQKKPKEKSKNKTIIEENGSWP